MKPRFYPWVFISRWYTVFWLLIHYICFMWKSQANCKQFKQLTFENQQNPSISALSEADLFSQKLLNYFTSIIRIFPLETSFSQQQFPRNTKSSFLPWCPSTGAMPTLPQSRGSATQTGEHTSQQPARECLASKLILSRHRMPELSFSFPERKLSHISELDT